MAETFGKDDEKATERILTAGELMRRRLGLGGSKSSTAKKSHKTIPETTVDLDTEIQRLEAALRQDDDDDDDSRSSSSDSSQSSGSSAGKVKGKRSRGEEVSSSDDKDAKGSGGVLCLSTVKDYPIEALPSQYLPTNKKRVLKNVDRDATGGKSSKKKRNLAASPTTAHWSHQVSRGLEQAVKEVLEGYQPRSSERLPFYCRVCAKQYGNEDDFFQHRQTDFHQAAVEMERKMSYCKLCRRQLTSPAQLKEHLQSKPHKERLARLQSNRRFGRSGA